MSETSTANRTLTIAAAKTPHLDPRSTEHGIVRQAFSRGRSRAVMVEKVKRRGLVHGAVKLASPTTSAQIAPASAAVRHAPAVMVAPRTLQPSRPNQQAAQRALTGEERERRARALVHAHAREEQERRARAEARKREEEDCLARDAETKRKAKEEVSRRAPKETKALAPEETEPKHVVCRPSALQALMKSRGRLTVTTATTGGDERMRSVASFRRRVQRLRSFGATEQKEKISREVFLPETITIQELASRMSERGVDVIRLLMKLGSMHKITDAIDADTAQLVAEELGHTVKRVAKSSLGESLSGAPIAVKAVWPGVSMNLVTGVPLGAVT